MLELRNWRKKVNLTQADAARLLGVTAAQISRYEAGKRQIAPERVVKFEKITGISRHVLRPDVFGPAPWETAA
jgi:transcriptional regulator with XRE-family HTH domain